MQSRFLLWISKWIPLYSIIPLIACFTFNSIVYSGVMPLTANRYHYDFTTSLDRKVPLIPEFLIIYFGCYLFWMVNYILIARQGKEHFYRFQVADLLSRAICFCFFLLIPTTNVRPEIVEMGMFSQLLEFLYQIDPATNLFPSIHCLVSWFCYIGIRGQKQVPKWYRGFSCVFAILVFVSTQVTKQHYIVDIIGAVIIAEFTYKVGQKTNIYHINKNFFEKINRRFGWEQKGGLESQHKGKIQVGEYER